MLIEHLTSERPITISARSRTVDQWQLLPGRENHLLDCVAMAAVAASISGVIAARAEIATRQRRRVEMPRPGERRVIDVKRWRR